ncbi:MAG: PKD repeat protein [Polyangiales bacterium]|jgi:PKD repeat protein
MMLRRVCVLCAFLVACGDDSTELDASSADAAPPDAPGQDAPIDAGRDVPPENMAPTAAFSVTSTDLEGGGVRISLDAGESTDADGTLESFRWTFSGDDEESGEGMTLEHTFATPGCYVVTLEVSDDDGATDMASADVLSTSAAVDDESLVFETQPLVNALLPRDVEANAGTATYTGTLSTLGPARLVARVTSGEETVSETSLSLCETESKDFTLQVTIPSELRTFDVALSVERGGASTDVGGTTNLVAGDVFIIQGQSNAASGVYSPDGGENDSPFVRTFGSRTDANPDADQRWRGAAEAMGHMGQWPRRMAAQLSVAHDLPIALMNAAIGGQPIGFFERNDGDPSDPATNYGRLFRRLRNAGLSESVRAILWYQGESDAGDWETHRDGFVALYEDWLEDYPSVERTYVTQLRLGCIGDLNRTQEVQRSLADEYEAISVMSTTALNAHDGCHYNYEEGYRELGDRYVALVRRDIYGDVFDEDVDAPNPMSARFNADRSEVTVQMRNADSVLSYEDGAEADFLLEGSGVTFSGGRVEGSQLILSVSAEASGATALHYRGRAGAGQWVTNERGIGLLSFHGLSLE